MSKILISSGPTRQFLDPVRYLTNASSGRMGAALAAAALELGHEVVVVSGPVEMEYPLSATVIPVVTTDEMLAACTEQFLDCDGMIGAAAPCDYKPMRVAEQKLAKNGEPLRLELWETPDIVATLSMNKQPHQWVVGFALETEDIRFRALAKMERKSCDLIVSNGPDAMNATDNEVEILDRRGAVLASAQGDKRVVASAILAVIERELIIPRVASRD